MCPFCPRVCSVLARAHGPSNPGLVKNGPSTADAAPSEEAMVTAKSATGTPPDGTATRAVPPPFDPELAAAHTVLADHIPRELTLDAMRQGAAATALVSGKAPDRPGFYYEPARRHPARMPENPHPLRRGNRLVPPAKPPSIFRSGLTLKLLGCLSAEDSKRIHIPVNGGTSQGNLRRPSSTAAVRPTGIRLLPRPGSQTCQTWWAQATVGVGSRKARGVGCHPHASA
jgi:hypothetical protein